MTGSAASTTQQALAVAAGAACGALARWRISLWLNERWSGFPLGTLLVNLLGGLLIGAALAWFMRSPNDWLRLLLVTGFMGGLTTFSAFSVESLVLLQRSQYGWALAHVLTHVAGSLLMAAVGFAGMRALID